jgi:hypothetical protein
VGCWVRGLGSVLLALALGLGPGVAGASAGQAAGSEGDVALWIERLGDPSGAVRGEAERALLPLLERRHGPLVAAALQAGDAERRARLEGVLGGHPRLLGLAVDLARGSDRAAESGRAALFAQVAHWRPGLDRRPLAGRELEARLAELELDRPERRWLAPESLDPRAAFDLLGRRAGPSVALVVDPELARAARLPGTRGAGAAAREGPWEVLAIDLARRHGLALDAAEAAPERPGEPGDLVWVRLVRPAFAGRSSPAAQLVDWLLAAEAPTEGADPFTRQIALAAARAVAATGWPAALDHFARRWRADPGDRAALAGLLVAAARGRVPDGLARPEGVRALLKLADGALAGGDLAQAQALQDALAGMPARSAAGEDLLEVLLEGFETAGERGRRLRLAAAEGLGAWNERLVAVLDRLLEGTAAGAPVERALLRQALATRAAAGPLAARRARVQAAPEALLRLEPGDEPALERARRLGRARLAPPEAWRAGPPADLDLAGRVLLVDGWLAGGDRAAAARHLGLLAEAYASRGGGPEVVRAALEPLLDDWRAAGRADEIDALLAGARGEAGGGVVLDRLALALGRLDAERRALWTALVEQGAGPVDPMLLADLAGGASPQAREQLLAGLRRALGVGGEPGPWADALARAHGRLIAAGRDREAAELRWAALVAARGAAARPLGAAILSMAWPHGVRREARSLLDEERPLVP